MSFRRGAIFSSSVSTTADQASVTSRTDAHALTCQARIAVPTRTGLRLPGRRGPAVSDPPAGAAAEQCRLAPRLQYKTRTTSSAGRLPATPVTAPSRISLDSRPAGRHRHGPVSRQNSAIGPDMAPRTTTSRRADRAGSSEQRESNSRRPGVSDARADLSWQSLSFTRCRRSGRPLHSYQAPARCSAPDLRFRHRGAGVRAGAP